MPLSVGRIDAGRLSQMGMLLFAAPSCKNAVVMGGDNWRRYHVNYCYIGGVSDAVASHCTNGE